MACLLTGTIATITSSIEGTLTPDSGGPDIPFSDEELGSKDIAVGSKVCYELITVGSTQIAINLKLITEEDEITVSPAPGDIEVKKNEFLTIRNGVTIQGNIEVNEGALRIAEGAIINGYIEAKKSSSVSIEEASKINGNTGGTANYLETKNGISTIVDHSTVDGKVEVRFSSQGLTLKSNVLIGGGVEAVRCSRVDINGNNDIVRSVEVSTSGDVTIEHNTIAGNLEVSGVTGTCRVCSNTVGGTTEVPPECTEDC